MHKQKTSISAQSSAHKRGDDMGDITASLDQEVVNMLTESAILSADLVQDLSKRSRGDRDHFENLLLNEGYLTEDQLMQMKARVHGWHFVDLRQQVITQEILSTIPHAFAKEQRVIPFTKKKGEDIALALVDPGNVRLSRILRKKFGSKTPIYFTSPSALSSILTRYETGFKEHCEDLLERYQETKDDKEVDDSAVELVDALMQHGVREGASDVHIEPRARECVVRERVDGVLKRVIRYNKEIHSLVALRIKVLCDLATDEHTAPQDGKFTYEDSDGKRTDVRVSVLATTHGEKIVMRLLAAQDRALSLELLGFSRGDLSTMDEEAHRPWGMILVTGPTGSGKTTTLYAALRKLNSDKVNISTIEDPVEYDLPGTNQIQVNEKAGLTFATGLRSIVRQDPDIVLVGEIRDNETAMIGVNAAMTGHLVLSTLHTNDASTAIPRLLDMGIEPFLITSTLNAVVAQRLVRQICVRCRESIEMNVGDLARSIPISILEQLSRKRDTIHLFKGKGCDLCGGTGYRGRSGIFEVLQMNDTIRELIMKGASANMIAKEAEMGGMTTMLHDGIEKVLMGITTIEEVLRVIRS